MRIGRGGSRATRPRARWEHEHTFTSDRLVVRPARRDDREAVIATIDDEVRYWQGFDDDAVERCVQTMAPEDDRSPPMGPASRFVVCDTDGSVIGAYRFDPPRPQGAHMTLGWWLGPNGRGRGLGVESLATLLSYADRVGLADIDMGTSVENARARRQIETTGAEVIECDVSHMLTNGRVDRGVWYRHTAGRVDGRR